MMVRDAQREMRQTFLGGFAGQMVSGALWLLSAALATWSSHRAAVFTLVVGGFFIFPLTQLTLKAMRRPTQARGNPLNPLAMQIAFTVPLGLPLVAAATLHRPGWFYPAFMLVIGAHYLPFTFLYGMGEFAILSGLLVAGGLAIGLYVPGAYPLGGWVAGAMLVLFAFAERRIALREAMPSRAGS